MKHLIISVIWFDYLAWWSEVINRDHGRPVPPGGAPTIGECEPAYRRN